MTEPRKYSVIEFNADGKAIRIEEKPKLPKSKYAVPGIYFYDDQVTEIAPSLKRSPRNELEITDVNLAYFRSRSITSGNFRTGIWLVRYWYT